MGLDPDRRGLVVGIQLRLLPLAWGSGTATALSARATPLLVVAVALSSSLQGTTERQAFTHSHRFADSAQSHARPESICFAHSTQPHAAGVDTHSDPLAADANSANADAHSVAAHADSANADTDSATTSNADAKAEADPNADADPDAPAPNAVAQTASDADAEIPEADA